MSELIKKVFKFLRYSLLGIFLLSSVVMISLLPIFVVSSILISNTQLVLFFWLCFSLFIFSLSALFISAGIDNYKKTGKFLIFLFLGFPICFYFIFFSSIVMMPKITNSLLNGSELVCGKVLKRKSTRGLVLFILGVDHEIEANFRFRENIDFNNVENKKVCFNAIFNAGYSSDTFYGFNLKVQE